MEASSWRQHRRAAKLERVIISLIWLPASVLAGLFQAWRTAIQQALRAQLSVSGAGLVRYFYGAPVALALMLIYGATHGLETPHLGLAFFGLAVTGGVAQIIGTNLLIMAFGYRNFVVGTAFAKTEAVQAALFAWLILGERLSARVVMGVVVGVAGVLVLALGGKRLGIRDLLRALVQPAALCGLGAGASFALTGVLVKAATEHMALTDFVAAALITLFVVMLTQTALHGAYVAVKERATWVKVFTTWRASVQVGLLSALGSACWFTGFATAPVALVRVVGQVEVIFTLAFAHFYLRERTGRFEVIGLLLVAAGVALAMWGGVMTHV
jgi:drug/metabolite transporter (DMT)-like permease